MTSTHTLDIPGGRLRYEIRGSGPLLLLTGAPMAGAYFGPLADALASDHTVVTHDPRGIAGSTLDDPEQDSTPDLRADDLAALLDALGAKSADVFGSSGGAVTGLALVTRHPQRVRTLVAHEPPLLELLPDAAEQHAEVDDMVRTSTRKGCRRRCRSSCPTPDSRTATRAPRARRPVSPRSRTSPTAPASSPMSFRAPPVASRTSPRWRASRAGWSSGSAPTRATWSRTEPRPHWPNGSAPHRSSSPGITAVS